MIYAKVMLARSLGFLTEDRYRACVQDLIFQGAQGIHLRGDSGGRSLGKGTIGGRGQDEGVPTVFVQASDGSYTGQIQVEAGSNHGLGMHRLDIHPGLVPNIGANAFFTADEDDHAFLSDGGLVLVTEASAARLEGIIMMMPIRNAFWGTDFFSLGTFRMDNPHL